MAGFGRRISLRSTTSIAASSRSLSDYLLFPLRMLDLRDYVYTETRAPDIRLLVLFALLVATAIALRDSPPTGGSDAGRRIGESTSARTNVAALTFTLASYLLWLGTSGNGRYAVALELFLGPMIVASALMFTQSRRTLGYLLGAVLLTQAIIVYVGADRRLLDGVESEMVRRGGAGAAPAKELPVPVAGRAIVGLSRSLS